jgi:Cu(I)/Ag(I) efflux system membrane fusion protein
VNTTGEEIRRNQVIATLYSKEVYGAHQDLLTAAAQVKRLTSDNARGAATATLAAARERLALLGVPPDELARMEQADQPTRALAIRSPFAGTVIERVATEGAYVETGAPLYRIADLSKVWVQLDAYERDLANLAVGQAVSLLVPNLDDPVAGTVSFIDPSLHPTRRTARVRVAISTPDNTLRPGLFVRATVSTRQADRAGSPLVIPDTAPLFTGKRSIVYVEVPTPTGTAYAPRPVRLGPKLGAFYPVVAGLTEGERVVSRGAFAIDADLQIQGGPSMMTHDDHAPVAQAAPVAGLSKAERRPLVPIVQGYLDVQRALAADDLPTAVSAAEQLEAPILAAVFAGDAQQAWQARVDLLRSNALAVKRANSLEDARGAFEPLSADVEHLLRTFGNPLDQSVHLAHCPMANSNQGATWIQQGDTVDNAYFGAMMRTCGDLLADVPPGGFLPADVRSPTSDHAGHDH